jgi:hypothetical protein
VIPPSRMHAKVQAAVGGVLLMGAALGGIYLHRPPPPPRPKPTMTLTIDYSGNNCHHPLPADPTITICG